MSTSNFRCQKMEAMRCFQSWLVPTGSRLGILTCTLSVWRYSDHFMVMLSLLAALCWQNCSCAPAGWGVRRAARVQTHHHDRQTLFSHSLWRLFYPDGLSCVFSSDPHVHGALLEASTSAQEMPAQQQGLQSCRSSGWGYWSICSDMCNPCLV